MMSTGNSEQWINLWVTPLATNNFCGEDATFSQEFEELKNEIIKDTSIHATNCTDWSIVLQIASEFLATKSKNIWALVYAVYAFFRLSELKESIQTFAILTKILSSHWDSLYPLPNRLQRRVAPLQWLSSRLETTFQNSNFENETIEVITDFKKECELLQEFLLQKLGENVPNFTKTINYISCKKLREEECKQNNADASYTNIKSEESHSHIVQNSDLDEQILLDSMPNLLRNLMAQNRKLAAHFLTNNIHDERAYQLHRTALWSTLLQLPISDKNGQTKLICSIPIDKISYYSREFNNKNYEKLLYQLEQSASKAPFWFEGHYMVVKCLEALEAKSALNVVKNGLIHLFERYPELLDYKFQCGKPFAPKNFREWIENHYNRKGINDQKINKSSENSHINEENHEEIIIKQAIQISIEQNFTTGLLHLCDSNTGKCRKFIYNNLIKAKFCIALGRKKTAIIILSSIYNKLKQWNLIEWEPSLTVNIISLFLSICNKPQDIPEDMLNCLYLLDTNAALNINKE